MFKRIWAIVCLLVLLGSVNYTNACGVCGYSMSNFNPELMMSSGSHSLGLFSQARWYTASLHNHGPGELGRGFSDYRRLQSNFELRGTGYVTPWLSFTGILPLSHNQLWREGESVENNLGLGDAVVLANFQILSEGQRMKDKGYQQRLVAGFGVKLPTGSFRSVGFEDEVTPSMQNGTGSTDFLFLAGYFINFGRFAISTNANYKVNTANPDDFRFANSLNAELRGMYIKRLAKVTLSPALGMRVESAGSVREQGFYDMSTGGQLLFGLAGMEVYHKDVSFSVTYVQPVYTRFAGEQFAPVAGLQAGFKYTFNKKVETTDQQL